MDILHAVIWWLGQGAALDNARDAVEQQLIEEWTIQEMTARLDQRSAPDARKCIPRSELVVDDATIRAGRP